MVGGVSSVPPVGLMRDLLVLLVRWNHQFNLVSRACNPADLLADALVDAAALTRVIEVDSGVVADLGAGAGLVSTALLLLNPGLGLELVEANAHKVSFLRRVAAMLTDQGRGGFRVINTRLDAFEGGPRWRTAFSRATWSPKEGWRRASPHLVKGGVYVALVGPKTIPPNGWNQKRYDELLPNPEDYSTRMLLWQRK